MTIQDQQLDELREALKESREDSTERRITINNPGGSSGTLGGVANQPYNNTVIGGGYSVNTAVGLNYPNTINNGYTYSSGTGTWGTTASNASAGKLTLNGENADIEINGVSLLEVLQDRLNMLVPNPTLEKEWTELKALGDQYRALEKDLREKAEMWDKLKKMPPPAPY